MPFMNNIYLLPNLDDDAVFVLLHDNTNAQRIRIRICFISLGLDVSIFSSGIE